MCPCLSRKTSMFLHLDANVEATELGWPRPLWPKHSRWMNQTSLRTSQIATSVGQLYGHIRLVPLKGKKSVIRCEYVYRRRYHHGKNSNLPIDTAVVLLWYLHPARMSSFLQEGNHSTNKCFVIIIIIIVSMYYYLHIAERMDKVLQLVSLETDLIKQNLVMSRPRSSLLWIIKQVRNQNCKKLQRLKYCSKNTNPQSIGKKTAVPICCLV